MALLVLTMLEGGQPRRDQRAIRGRKVAPGIEGNTALSGCCSKPPQIAALQRWSSALWTASHSSAVVCGSGLGIGYLMVMPLPRYTSCATVGQLKLGSRLSRRLEGWFPRSCSCRCSPPVPAVSKTDQELSLWAVASVSSCLLRSCLLGFICKHLFFVVDGAMSKACYRVARAGRRL